MVGVDGKPLVQLPEVLRYQHQVDLNKEVRALYDDVAGEIGKSVKASIEDGSAKPSYTHICTPRLVARYDSLGSFAHTLVGVDSVPAPSPAPARVRPVSRPLRLYRGVRSFTFTCLRQN